MNNKIRAGLGQRLAAYFYHRRGAVHRHLGHLHGDRDEYCLAVADLDRAIRLNPNLVQALYDRGLLLWRELNDGPQAERDLTAVIQLDPERAEAWFNRAFARQLTGNAAGALADLAHYLACGSDPMWREICQSQIEILQTPPQASPAVEMRDK